MFILVGIIFTITFVILQTFSFVVPAVGFLAVGFLIAGWFRGEVW